MYSDPSITNSKLAWYDVWGLQTFLFGSLFSTFLFGALYKVRKDGIMCGGIALRLYLEALYNAWGLFPSRVHPARFVGKRVLC